MVGFLLLLKFREGDGEFEGTLEGEDLERGFDTVGLFDLVGCNQGD